MQQKARVPTVTTSIPHSTRSPSQNKYASKRNKKNLNIKEVKLFLLEEDIISRKLKDATKKIC